MSIGIRGLVIYLYLLETYAIAVSIRPGCVKPASFWYLVAASIVVHLIATAIMWLLKIMVFAIVKAAGKRKLKGLSARILLGAMYAIAYTLATRILAGLWAEFYTSGWLHTFALSLGPALAYATIALDDELPIRISGKPGVLRIRRSYEYRYDAASGRLIKTSQRLAKSSRGSGRKRSYARYGNSAWWRSYYRMITGTFDSVDNRRKRRRLLNAYEQWRSGEISFGTFRKRVERINAGTKGKSTSKKRDYRTTKRRHYQPPERSGKRKRFVHD